LTFRVAAHPRSTETQTVAPDAKPVISVQVRELVEFALRAGDLGAERDFVGRNRALAGTRGHQQVQRSRPDGYQKEVRLFYDLPADDFILRIQGRIDGVVTTGTEVLLEEIKTVQGRWAGVADPLHWAQVKVYGFIYAHDHALDLIDLRLTYLNLDTGELTELLQRFALAELSRFFQQTTAIYLEWVREQQQWRRQRDQSIRVLDFPFRRYRPGQRDVAVATYRAITRRERLFLEAPTGIGKTISVLFPAVKALAEGKVETIFYLTARTTARAAAEKAISDLRQAGLRLRSLTLTAKDKICLREGQPCDPQTCPLAQGYYDRSKAAMRGGLAQEEITRPALEAFAREHQVCPFELSLDLSSWVDVVICDYNYVFDPKVYLRRHFSEDNHNYVFLVDEAHNLVDRGREMFSAELSRPEIDRVKWAIKGAVPRCAQALGNLSAAIRKLCAPAGAVEPAEARTPAAELNLFWPAPPGGSAPDSTVRMNGRSAAGEGRGEWTSAELPSELLPLLENALQQAEAWLARNESADFRSDLLELYFRLHSFQRAAERYDERFRTILGPDAPMRVRLFCLDPSSLLRQALGRGKAAALFSATFTPLEYYRDLLGGNPEDPLLRLPSPFPPENLAVLVQDGIRTHFKDRAGTMSQVADLIGAVVRERAGNYMIYLPSYQYLSALRESFQCLYPAVPIRVQRAGMTEGEREEFLRAFAAEPTGTQVGFAVMGGVFGEGIDLTGDRLIGAIIVGVGLPQLCLDRDLIRDYFQEKVGRGFDYAYTFPGMNRVLQAVGRVIRSETDRGVVLLIDTRFGEARYRQMFPAWWQARRVRNLAAVTESLRAFWESNGA
jgi:DNA excision repair protein ERCC-2